MGYCIEQRRGVFCIKATNQPGALQAIKALTAGGAWYAYVDPLGCKKAQTLEEALHAWGWQADMDPVSGDVITIKFEGVVFQSRGLTGALDDYLRDYIPAHDLDDPDAFLFQAIAPFVEKGSFIEMQGEGGSAWRWAFDGTKMTELGGELHFPEQKPEHPRAKPPP